MRKILFLYFLLFSFVVQEAPVRQMYLNVCETEMASEVESKSKHVEEFLSQERVRLAQKPSSSKNQELNAFDAGLNQKLADQSHQLFPSARKHLYHMQFLI